MIQVTKYPKSEKYDISAIADNGSGYVRMTVTGVNDYTNIIKDSYITTFSSDLFGTDKVTLVDNSTPNQLTIDLDLLYTGQTADGFIITNKFSPIPSKFSPAFNTPVFLGFLRRDIEVLSVYTDTNNNLFVELESVPVSLVIGDKIYLYSEGVYDNVYTIEDVQVDYIQLTGTFISATTSGFINSNVYRKNHRLQLTINDETTLLYYPNYKGIFDIDIHEILLTQLSQTDLYNYSDVSLKDENLCKSFTFTYTELYDNSTIETVSVTDRFYYTYAIGSINNQRYLVEYLINAENQLPLAKFLCKGRQGIYLDNNGRPAFPYAVDVLSSVGSIQKIEDVLSVNNDVLESNVTLLTNIQGGVSHIRFDNDYINTAKSVDFYLSFSALQVEHFAEVIGLDGELIDGYGMQNGELRNANCIRPALNSKIIFPFDVTIYSYLGDCVPVANGNEITFSQDGRLYDLTVTDSNNVQYYFPCTEYYTSIETGYIIHGFNAVTNEKLWALYIPLQTSNIFSSQNQYFWDAIHGMSKVQNTDNTNEKIYIPNSINNVSLLHEGIGYPESLIGLTPIA